MRKLVIAGGLVLASAVGAQAADLIVDEAPMAMDTSLVNSSIYVQLLGGVALAGSVDYNFFDTYSTTQDTDAGFAVAGTIGVVVMDGLSLEADVMYSKSAFSGDDIDFTTLSLMANAKYTLELNDMFSIYGAAGIGQIAYTSGSADYAGLGYQLIAGVGAKLTDNISAVAEYRYQNTFDFADQDDGDYSLQAPSGTLLAGLKFSF